MDSEYRPLLEDAAREIIIKRSLPIDPNDVPGMTDLQLADILDSYRTSDGRVERDDPYWDIPYDAAEIARLIGATRTDTVGS